MADELKNCPSCGGTLDDNGAMVQGRGIESMAYYAA